MKMNLKNEYKSMKELNRELENQIFFFRRYGGMVYKSADEAIASFADDDEVKDELVFDKEITIDDQQKDENGYTPTHTAEVKVTAYFTDPGSDDYVYTLTVEEDIV